MSQAQPASAVIAISSHVARGSVGNRAMVFALERLGFETWSVPTILLPRHRGYGAVEAIVPDDGAFARLLDALVDGGRAAAVAGIVTGYFATAGEARAAAALVASAKAARPDALYLCDPVIGDSEKLYVPDDLASAVRDTLLPLADIATPNAFECAWLAGATDPRSATDPDYAALARALPPPAILVTSAPAMMRGHIANLLVTEREAILFEHPKVETHAKGTGDLLAALLLARRLKGQSIAKATETALASLFEVIAKTAKAGGDELMLPAFQDALVSPLASIVARRLGPRQIGRGGVR